MGPRLAVGDGALGFWSALPKVVGEARRQRCWMHKSGNVLDKLPKHAQARAKDNLHQIWMAETNAEAEKTFDHFIDSYEAKYPKATECLSKDRDVLLHYLGVAARPANTRCLKMISWDRLSNSIASGMRLSFLSSKE